MAMTLTVLAEKSISVHFLQFHLAVLYLRKLRRQPRQQLLRLLGRRWYRQLSRITSCIFSKFLPNLSTPAADPIISVVIVTPDRALYIVMGSFQSQRNRFIWTGSDAQQSTLPKKVEIKTAKDPAVACTANNRKREHVEVLVVMEEIS